MPVAPIARTLAHVIDRAYRAYRANQAYENAKTAAEFDTALAKLPEGPTMVKSQIHAGGRGKGRFEGLGPDAKGTPAQKETAALKALDEGIPDDAVGRYRAADPRRLATARASTFCHDSLPVSGQTGVCSDGAPTVT